MRRATVLVSLLSVAAPSVPSAHPARVFITRAPNTAPGSFTVAVKDNLETTDLPTTAGALELRDGAVPRPTLDASVVTRVRTAGGVIVGKTNLDTWARGVRSVSAVLGQTENAIDPTRAAGGSSGGTAVAVAAHLADVGLGSDTCGSLRYPAVYNGVLGLRPTPGLVSRAGLVPLAPTQDVVGPMARTARELAEFLEVVQGPDERDPLTLDAAVAAARPPLGSYVAAVAQPLAGVRIGVVESMVRAAAPAMRDAARHRIATWQAAGAVVVTVTLPGLPAASVIDDEALPARALYLAERRRGAVGDVPSTWLAGPLVVADPRGYATRLAAQARGRAALVRLLDANRLDALAYPTTPFEPVRLGQRQPSANCHLAATTGLPALAVPDRPDRFGGVDVLGRPFAEPLLLRIAAAAAL